MARCEDWPCCGHEAGCCPDYDESGKQLNMKCVCGATLPVNNRFSICDSCMNASLAEDNFEYDEYLEDIAHFDAQRDYPDERYTEEDNYEDR